MYVIFLPPSSTQLQFPVHLKAVIICQSIHGWEKISLEIAEAVIFILRQRGVLLEAWCRLLNLSPSRHAGGLRLATFSSHALHTQQARTELSQENPCDGGVWDARFLPGQRQVRSEKMQKKCSPTHSTGPLSRCCWVCVCVCVAITVQSPPSVSEEPAWSLVKECSQTCCRDFASRVICTAFLSLCSRKEHLAYGYLDALQKNKALHYEKGSHSLKNKKNKKCKKSCKMWNKYRRKETLYKSQLHQNPHKLWSFQHCDEVMQSGRLWCLEEWRSPTCSPHVACLPCVPAAKQARWNPAAIRFPQPEPLTLHLGCPQHAVLPGLGKRLDVVRQGMQG